MQSWAKRFVVVVLILSFPNALAHLDSVRILISFPNQVQQGFKLSAVGTSSGLKITGAKLSVQVQGAEIVKDIAFTETQSGVYEISEQFKPGEYNFKFIDKTFPNEFLEYSIKAVLPRPIHQSSLMFVWPPTRVSPVSSVWLVLFGAPVSVFLILGFAWFQKYKQNTQVSQN
jgi:hypothetical protein